MLALHYYSNSESVRAALRQVAAAWWCQDDDPVYSKDLIKEFEVENPPLEDELAWILAKGTARCDARESLVGADCQFFGKGERSGIIVASRALPRSLLRPLATNFRRSLALSACPSLLIRITGADVAKTTNSVAACYRTVQHKVAAKWRDIKRYGERG